MADTPSLARAAKVYVGMGVAGVGLYRLSAHPRRLHWVCHTVRAAMARYATHMVALTTQVTAVPFTKTVTVIGLMTRSTAFCEPQSLCRR